jgi:hypothetical protein
MESSPQPSSPFDFDEDDVEGTRREKGLPKNWLLRWCCIFAIGSFIVSFVGSVVENNAAGNLSLESTATAINRAGMLGMLAGCVGIFVAFRAPMLLTARPGGIRQQARWSAWWQLVFWNVVGYFFLVAGLFVIGLFTQGAAIYFSGFPISLGLAMLVVIALWHEGVVRAYAIGVLSSLFLQLPVIIPWLWSIPFSGGGGYGYQAYTLSANDVNYRMFLLLAGIVLFALFTGLFCSGYVAFLERSRRQRALTDSNAPEVDKALQLPSA